jgi:hypothetical protein
MDEKLRLRVRAQYEKFVKDRGELFEKLSLPMDNDDRSEVKKKQRLVALFLAPLLLIIISIALYFVWEGSTMNYLFLGFPGAVVVLTVINYFNYESILKENNKNIVRGVLTDKQKIDDGDTVDYDFELSNKETIGVSRSDFKKFSLGDILEIQLLSEQNSLSLKTKIKLLGTIFDK